VLLQSKYNRPTDRLLTDWSTNHANSQSVHWTISKSALVIGRLIIYWVRPQSNTKVNEWVSDKADLGTTSICKIPHCYSLQ